MENTKRIKARFIDTAGHGYYSVSKKDFKKVMGENGHTLISKYSGHTFTRMYLEEDMDATTFFKAAADRGFDVKLTNSYNPKHNITHCYKPELFEYKPEVGGRIKLHNNKTAKIERIGKRNIYARSEYAPYGLYKISKRRFFYYVVGLAEELDAVK